MTIPFLNPTMGNLSKCRTLRLEPTCQGECGLGVSPWEGTELGSSMVKQDYILGTKNPLLLPS